MDVLFKKLNEAAKVPTYATDGAAAADLYALCPKDGVHILPGDTALIPTGIAIELPNNQFAAFLFARSGLAIKSGLSLANGVGVIDSDYRGEVCVGVYNHSKSEYIVQNGERIAQLAIMPVIIANFVQASSLEGTKRGDGGFGSTGK